MTPRIDPEPVDDVRQAIVTALGCDSRADDEGWSAAALLEAVDDGELDP